MKRLKVSFVLWKMTKKGDLRIVQQGGGGGRTQNRRLENLKGVNTKYEKS